MRARGGGAGAGRDTGKGRARRTRAATRTEPIPRWSARRRSTKPLRLARPAEDPAPRARLGASSSWTPPLASGFESPPRRTRNQKTHSSLPLGVLGPPFEHAPFLHRDAPPEKHRDHRGGAEPCPPHEAGRGGREKREADPEEHLAEVVRVPRPRPEP